MRILSAKEAKLVDRLAIKKFNIIGTNLMENAGEAIAKRAACISEGGLIGIICGKGNNGGDGFACAVKLRKMGLNCELFLTASVDLLSDDSKHFYSLCLELGIPMKHSLNAKDVNLNHLDIIIDGLLGIGITGEVRDHYRRWIELINNSGAIKISIDIPSGINATSGDVCGLAVNADRTVTMGFLKQGLVIQPGKSLAGEVEIADLGYPEEVYNGLGDNKNFIDESLIDDCIKSPKINTYKHKQGKLLLLAGSRVFTGAAILAGNAAMRSGAGLVLSIIPESINGTLEKCLIAPITFPLQDDGKGFLDENAISSISEKLDWCDAVLMGPGLGTNPAVLKIVKFVINEATKPVLIDADALTHISNCQKDLKKTNTQLILTPHYGEASRIFNIDLKQIRKDPFSFISNVADESGCVVVLKGSPTIIASKQETVVNTTGHQGLATAGSGDVLSGIMGSFLCQGFPTESAAKLAVFIHGKCADTLLHEKGYRGLIASDLISKVPSVLAGYELK